MKIREISFVIVLLAAAVFFKVVAYSSISAATGFTVEAWMFPDILATSLIALIVCAGLFYRKTILNKVEMHNPKLMIATILVCVVSFLAWRYIHFILGMLVFFFALGYFYKLLTKKYVVSAVAVPVFLYFLLIRVFNVLL